MDGARCHTKEYRTITRVVIGQALRRLPVVVEIKTTTEAASCNCLKAREHEYCKSGAGGKHRSCLYCRGGKWLARYGWLVACDYRSGRASGPAAGLPPCLKYTRVEIFTTRSTGSFFVWRVLACFHWAYSYVELLPWRVLWRGTASASHATVVPAPSRICTFFLACFESSIGGRARVGEPRTGRGSGCWDSCPRHRCVRNSLVPAIKSCGAVISEENSRIAV